MGEVIVVEGFVALADKWRDAHRIGDFGIAARHFGERQALSARHARGFDWFRAAVLGHDRQDDQQDRAASRHEG